MTENEIGEIVDDAAIAVHRALGLGLLVLTYSDTSPQSRKARGEKTTKESIESLRVRLCGEHEICP